MDSRLYVFTHHSAGFTSAYPMTDAEIYRRAAELIDSNKEVFSCCAVDAATSYVSDFTSQRLNYASVFNLHGETKEIRQLHSIDWNERRNLRVLMLLMMAAMVEGE